MRRTDSTGYRRSRRSLRAAPPCKPAGSGGAARIRSLRFALALALLLTGLFASSAQAGKTAKGPSPKPGFSIEKLQAIEGSKKGFTVWPLSGKSGQTVDYQLIVTNTGNVPLSFSKFTDSHCDAGTIKGGPGESALAPKASTTYTCSHLLSEAGLYINIATDTATPPPGDGVAITRISNPVLVIVPAEPAFTIEKRQEIAGSGEGFTTSKLSGMLGQTVDYQVIVANTGNVPLTLSKFTDSHCDAGQSKAAPGQARSRRKPPRPTPAVTS